jgi:hypothetical protein
MNNPAYRLLLAIGACHALMKEHANGVRSWPNVKSISHWVDMYNIQNAFRLEEYVDAELSSGHAISWRLELTVREDLVAVEADIRRIHEKGQDVVAEIADCVYSTTTDCCTGLLEVARQLCSTSPV